MSLSKDVKRKTDIKWRIESVYAILPLLFYLANLYRMTEHSSLPYRVSINVIGILGVVEFILARKQNVIVVLTLYIYFITGVMNFLAIGNVSLTDVVADILLFGITLVMLRYHFTYIQGALAYYIIAATFLWFYRNGINTHYVLTSSGNYISVLLIISASLYYIALHNSGRRMKIWDVFPALLNFFLSVWARGRGGISATFVMLILIGLVFLNGMERKMARRIILSISVVVIALVIVSHTNFSVVNWFFSLGKWGYKGIENAARFVIWRSYYDKMGESLTYFVFGAPLRDIPIIAGYGGNCHNSFLQLHAYNGIFMILLLMILLILSAVHYIRRRQWIMLSVLLVFCIRAFTDKFVFGQYGMPVMMYLVLYPYTARH